MALIKCTECGREISDKAATCPQCAAPVASTTPKVAPSAPLPANAPTNVPPLPLHRKGVSATTIVLVSILGALVVGIFIMRQMAGSSSRVGRPSPSLLPTLHEPEHVVSERIALKEGEAKMYSFTLNRSPRVEVKVQASPKPVDVMLMTADDLEKYKEPRASCSVANFRTVRRSRRREC
jgi:hypothetical protein